MINLKLSGVNPITKHTDNYSLISVECWQTCAQSLCRTLCFSKQCIHWQLKSERQVSIHIIGFWQTKTRCVQGVFHGLYHYLSKNLQLKRNQTNLEFHLRNNEPLNQNLPKGQNIPIQNCVIKQANVWLYKVKTKNLHARFLKLMANKKFSFGKCSFNYNSADLVHQAISAGLLRFVVLIFNEFDRNLTTKSSVVLNDQKIHSSKDKPVDTNSIWER